MLCLIGLNCTAGPWSSSCAPSSSDRGTGRDSGEHILSVLLSVPLIVFILIIINLVSGGFLNTSIKLRGLLRRFPTGFLKTDFPKKLDFFSLDNWWQEILASDWSRGSDPWPLIGWGSAIVIFWNGPGGLFGPFQNSDINTQWFYDQLLWKF